jgi:hypothetical protein
MKPDHTPTGQPPDHGSRSDLIRMALTTKQLVNVMALLLFLAYGWLKLKGVPVGMALGRMPADVVVKAALVIYYTSWVSGLISDTTQQQILYAVAPTGGRYPWEGYGIGVTIALMFGILAYVNTSQQFAVALVAFVLFNLFSWRYLVNRILTPVYAGSKVVYREQGEHLSLFQLDVLWRYLAGPWQWWRFAYGILASLVLVILAFTAAAEELSDRLRFASPETLIALAVMSYVLTFEGWIWYERLRMKIAQDAVAAFWPKYRVVPGDE